MKTFVMTFGFIALLNIIAGLWQLVDGLNLPRTQASTAVNVALQIGVLLWALWLLVRTE